MLARMLKIYFVFRAQKHIRAFRKTAIRKRNRIEYTRGTYMYIEINMMAKRIFLKCDLKNMVLNLRKAGSGMKFRHENGVSGKISST